MKIFEFERCFPNEESCKAKFKEIREKRGIKCPKCGCKHHYWMKTIEMYQCTECGKRQSLTAHTVMHSSKLPFRYWFVAIHLLTSTKHSFSAAELQRQLDHSRYQPIWELLHKLRSVMGQREDEYTLCGNIEFDEGFFTTELPEDQKNEKLKAGAGSQRKAKVAVMAEVKEKSEKSKSNKPTNVKYIKMIVVPNLKADTISAVAEDNINPNSTIITDASTSHTNFKNYFREHKSQVIDPKDIGKVLPWVHIAIGNSKSSFRATHYGIKPEFMQGYLNEFCYKFNRRYFGENIFDRLMMAGVSYRTEFKHITYRKAA